MGMDKHAVPVLVGVSQLICREKTVEQMDPLKMMVEAARNAALDAAIDDISRIDTVYVVNCLSKKLTDPAQGLSMGFACTPVETGYSSIGGTAPQWLVNRAAERIYHGSSEIVLICGAEALYTHGKPRSMDRAISDFMDELRLGGDLPYMGDTRSPVSNIEQQYGMETPVKAYALIENALRAHQNMAMEDHFQELCSFCANLSDIASRNPFAWAQEAKTAREIGTLNELNRMIAFPYTKFMCSNLVVNQAAALIMTNLAKAEALGIPRDKMVFLRGFGDDEDVWFVSERPDLWASPSVRTAVYQALAQAHLSIDEVKYLDFYSCFPSPPRITREMLGLSKTDSRPLTVTGGMSSFGGPGNNYTMHAICTMIEKLRKDPDALGLVEALSWFVSKHSVGLYSGSPGDIPWVPAKGGNLKGDIQECEPVKVVEEAGGRGRVESYTILYKRDGDPYEGVVIGREASNNRFLAKVRPEKGLLEAMTRDDIIGIQGRVEYDPSNAINWFYL